jgi:uncharacterized YigZ family protein
VSMMAFTYKTVAEESLAEFSDRGSKFIAFAMPVETQEQMKQALKKCKLLHPKAVHHCYAFRIGFDNNNYRASDDGEPSGSAGRPILGQIDSAQLSNVLIVVVRYFGGVLLGVPGLIHAYKTVAQMAIQQNQIIEKKRMQFYKLKFDYTVMNEVMRILKAHHCEVKKQQQGLFCQMEIGIALDECEAVIEKIKKIQGVEVDTA